MQAAGYYAAEDCRVEDLAAICGGPCDDARISHAEELLHGVPVYDAATLDLEVGRRSVMAEWAWVLRAGPGVVVLRQGCPDLAAIDAATAVFEQIIAEERGAARADHFAAAGNNDRVWNSLQKLCLRAPEVFVRYFAAPAIDAVCEAWLGPGYQMSTQVNLVRPGGQAQKAHRDYHLGFQTAEALAQFPAHVHELSPTLTLQGAVAHCDMPVESGPTKLLPYSQSYAAGYAAYSLEAFQDYFEQHHIQLALRKGDALFFNPALFHAAGANVSADIQRMANLMQIGSAMGRVLEAIDRDAMCNALYPVMTGHPPDAARRAVIAACAEGYSFPTNLDTDPPIGGLAPATQAALFARALDEGMSARDFGKALEELRGRRRA